MSKRSPFAVARPHTALVTDACPSLQFVIVEWEAATTSGENQHPSADQLIADVTGRVGVPGPGSGAGGLSQDVVAAIRDFAKLGSYGIGTGRAQQTGTFPKIPGPSFLACYFGIVQGNSPGWSLAHESPLHDEFGSSGGPHQGERSVHQYSPVNMPIKIMKPRSVTRANTRAAVSHTGSSVVTVAPYAAVTVCVRESVER